MLKNHLVNMPLDGQTEPFFFLAEAEISPEELTAATEEANSKYLSLVKVDDSEFKCMDDCFKAISDKGKSGN